MNHNERKKETPFPANFQAFLTTAMFLSIYIFFSFGYKIFVNPIETTTLTSIGSFARSYTVELFFKLRM